MKKFNAKDGMAVELLLKNKIKTILLTSESSTIVKKRGKKINAAMTITGAKNKKSHFNLICKKFEVSPQQIAYIGDDINCFELLSHVGIAACPNNAVAKIKSIPNILQLERGGGEGVVREFVELFLE